MTMSTSREERDELRAIVRQLMTKRSDEASVRATMDSEHAFDEALWSELVDMGLAGLGVPEEFGGAGAGWAELGVVFEETGRALACVPLLASAGLAVPALLASGDTEAMRRWLPAIADGSLIATAAVLEDGQAGRGPSVRAIRTGSGWLLEGSVANVLDAGVAGLILVLAETDSGPTFFAVETTAIGLSVTPRRTSDLTRRLSLVQLAGVAAVPLGLVGDGARLRNEVRGSASVALAWEQVGGATAVLDLSVDYAKTREQFGRPIGSFQAVKHMCADMLVAVETARSAAWEASRHRDEGRDAELETLLARVVCSEAFVHCSSTTIQIHGGLGFTWEHPAHLYVKRSRASAVLVGTPSDGRAHLLTRIPALQRRGDVVPHFTTPRGSAS